MAAGGPLRRLALLLCCAGLGQSLAKVVTIDNTRPSTDAHGGFLGAGDGKVVRGPDGVYYWYAANYGDCKEPAGDSGCAGSAPGACGFQLNHNVSVYTSTDLATWTNHGTVLRMQDVSLTNAVLFCPKVLFNKAKGTVVLWFNWISGSDFTVSHYAVATGTSPFGPFKVLRTDADSTLGSTNPGDFNLFEDGDGSAYIIYTSHITGAEPTHRMSVEALNADFTASLGAQRSSGFFGDTFVEAPAMFKRGSTYYATFGSCCCYCKSGTAVSVYTAPQPLGPWTKRNAIGLGAAESVGAQQTDVFGWIDAAGVEQFMYLGDRWQSSPDGLKSHDLKYWFPLEFTADGNVTAMANVPTVSINIASPSASADSAILVA